MFSSNIYTPIAPTYLYIKQHSVTGLKYFGKTSKEDPIKYLGSGVRWNQHIKKHGAQFVKTIWLSDLYYDTSISEHALHFSAENKIDTSPNVWANLIPENGMDGAILGIPRSEETKTKISAANKGKKKCPFSDEHKAKISATQTGKKQSIESNVKRSNTLLNKTPKEKAISKQKGLDTKNSRTPEEKLTTRKKMSESQKGRTHTEESIEIMRSTKIGIPRTEETILKMRHPRLKFFSIIETRKTYSKGVLSRYYPELRIFF
jgi:hypothetical protein